MDTMVVTQDDESDFDPDAFSIAETRILWIDRVYRDAYDIVLRTKQRMINIWITFEILQKQLAYYYSQFLEYHFLFFH